MNSTSIRIRNRLRRMASNYLARRPLLNNLKNPLISFTFDDFPASAYDTGGRILAGSNLRGTYYVSLGLANTIQPTGPCFHTEQLEPLITDGHELGCHTYHHLHAWDTSTGDFVKSIHANTAQLQQLIPSAKFHTLSYPISCPRPAIKQLSAKHFDACRAGGQTFNGRQLDLNSLRSYFLERAHSRMETISTVIDANYANRGWLIFSTHDISDKPTVYGCKTSFFEAVVDLSVRSGSTILPVNAALALIRESNQPHRK